MIKDVKKMEELARKSADDLKKVVSESNFSPEGKKFALLVAGSAAIGVLGAIKHCPDVSDEETFLIVSIVLKHMSKNFEDIYHAADIVH